MAGDVTWVHRVLPNSLWATPGGTFVLSASATLQVADVGSYTFASTAQLVGDVQGWLDDPSTNFGWLLVVDSPPTASAKRFDSRENGTASNRPKLTIAYGTTVGKPTGSFSFTPANPRPGDEVQFTDDSTGGLGGCGTSGTVRPVKNKNRVPRTHPTWATFRDNLATLTLGSGAVATILIWNSVSAHLFEFGMGRI